MHNCAYIIPLEFTYKISCITFLGVHSICAGLWKVFLLYCTVQSVLYVASSPEKHFMLFYFLWFVLPHVVQPYVHIAMQWFLNSMYLLEADSCIYKTQFLYFHVSAILSQKNLNILTFFGILKHTRW